MVDSPSRSFGPTGGLDNDSRYHRTPATSDATDVTDATVRGKRVAMSGGSLAGGVVDGSGVENFTSPSSAKRPPIVLSPCSSKSSTASLVEKDELCFVTAATTSVSWVRGEGGKASALAFPSQPAKGIVQGSAESVGYSVVLKATLEVRSRTKLHPGCRGDAVPAIEGPEHGTVMAASGAGDSGKGGGNDNGDDGDDGVSDESDNISYDGEEMEDGGSDNDSSPSVICSVDVQPGSSSKPDNVLIPIVLVDPEGRDHSLVPRHMLTRDWTDDYRRGRHPILDAPHQHAHLVAQLTCEQSNTAAEVSRLAAVVTSQNVLGNDATIRTEYPPEILENDDELVGN